MKSNLKQQKSQAQDTIEQDAIAFLRNRQMSGLGVISWIEDQPAWYWAMQRQAPRAVETALDLGSLIDDRLLDGRGFLLAGMDCHMPRWLIVHGLRRLDYRWWLPDKAGRSILEHEGVDAVIAQALGQRAWSEGSTNRILAALGNPISKAKAKNKPNVARVWSQWFSRH